MGARVSVPWSRLLVWGPGRKPPFQTPACTRQFDGEPPLFPGGQRDYSSGVCCRCPGLGSQGRRQLWAPAPAGLPGTRLGHLHVAAVRRERTPVPVTAPAPRAECHACGSCRHVCRLNEGDRLCIPPDAGSARGKGSWGDAGPRGTSPPVATLDCGTLNAHWPLLFWGGSGGQGSRWSPGPHGRAGLALGRAPPVP